MLSITWGCWHMCSWDPSHLCLLLSALGCGLKVEAFSFRDRIQCGKGGVRRDLGEQGLQSCLVQMLSVVSLLQLLLRLGKGKYQ